MPNLMQTIASAFEAEPKTSTIADVGLVANRLTAPLMGNLGFGGQQRSQQNSSQSHSALASKPGKLYVHAQRSDEPIPSFQPLQRTGIPDIDAAFDLKSAQLQHEMAREFSDFSLAGLSWAEACSREDAQIAAERAKEDAALARKRMEEDAAIAARRGAAGRGAHAAQRRERRRVPHEAGGGGGGAAAAVEGQVRRALRRTRRGRRRVRAASGARRAEDARGARARAEKAAREAALAAERATRQTELAEDARRLAEMATLRLSTTPSVRALILVSAEHVPPALAYACPIAGTPSAPPTVRGGRRCTCSKRRVSPPRSNRRSSPRCSLPRATTTPTTPSPAPMPVTSLASSPQDPLAIGSTPHAMCPARPPTGRR